MVDIFIPNYVETALRLLNDNGYKAYIVGGCVRDIVLGRNINDYDICTSSLPEQTKLVFSKYNVIETGIDHGTVTVVIDGHYLEITTLRVDKSYSDGRHPDAVEFTSDIVADLSRRDFTVNAIAYTKSAGIIDPFNGMNDIDNKLIRCVGSPDRRFKEDGLRILRAFRFASVLGFNIESKTEISAFNSLSLLDKISYERIRDEFLKLIVGDNAKQILLKYPYIISKIIPEMSAELGFDQNNPHHDFDLYTHSVYTATSLKKDPILRLCGLIHDIGKTETKTTDENGVSHYFSHAKVGSDIVRKICNRLRLSNNDKNRIIKLIEHHDYVIDETPKSVKRKINKLGVEIMNDLLDLQLADNISQKYEVDKRKILHNEKIRIILSQILYEEQCYNLGMLKINGYDLMNLGYSGKQIGKALRLLLDAVVNGECENDLKALSLYLKKSDNEIRKVMP